MTMNESFVRTIKGTYGEAGEAWLSRLPALINQCAMQWHLTNLKPIANLTYNYVLFAEQRGAKVVLKLRCDAAELNHEAAALLAFTHHGGVKMLAHDQTLQAILLERVQPGASLTSYFPDHDVEATTIAAELLKRLHAANSKTHHQFPSLTSALPDLKKDFPELAPFIQHARTLKHTLLSQQTTPVLLHGDFHSENIVSAGYNQWLALDPSGILGDPIYDLAVYIRNPLKPLVTQAHAAHIVKQRVAQFSKLLGYPAQRIADWTYLQTVCSAYWSLEDGLDVTFHQPFLNVLHAIT